MNSWDEQLTEEQKKQVKISLGHALKFFRKKLRKPIIFVADETGIKPPHLSRMERGLRNPPEKEMIYRMAEALGASESLLLKAAGYERKSDNSPYSKKEIEQFIDVEVIEPLKQLLRKTFN